MTPRGRDQERVIRRCNIQLISCMVGHVTERDEDRADALFHALADRTRRDIVRRVLAGEHSVSALAAAYDMSFAAVQKHVAVLERAGLVTRHRHGREQLVRARIEGVETAQAFLDQYEQVWRGRTARFGQLLADPDPGDNP